MSGFATDFTFFSFFTSSQGTSVQTLSSYQWKCCFRESLIFHSLLNTLSCQNDPIEAMAHFQKPLKCAVIGHACVFRYVCLLAVLEQRGSSALVCSTPCMLASCAHWWSPGVLLWGSCYYNIHDFLPLPHSVVPGGATAPAWMLLNSAVWDTATFLSCKSLESPTSSPKQVQSMTCSHTDDALLQAQR